MVNKIKASANSVDKEQTPIIAASYLILYCLSMSIFKTFDINEIRKCMVGLMTVGHTVNH